MATVQSAESGVARIGKIEMTGKKSISITGVTCDPEIDRLLYLHKALRSIVQNACKLLDARRFPKSSRAAATLAKRFEAELELNLMRAYNAAPPPAED
jgi:hypothetical protein